jgi:hypothetical protein
MARYLDPKNDLTFKKVFGEHKNLCISLLNAMLPLGEGRRVETVEYRTGEQFPRFDGGHNTIVDVRCEDNFGRQFIVEMQMYWKATFLQRVLLNASKAYIAQFDNAGAREKNSAEARRRRGGAKEKLRKQDDPFKLLKPVYALNFVNEVFEPDTDEYYHDYAIVNVANTEKRIEGLELVFIELPKFAPKNRAVRKLRDLWLLYMTAIHRGDEAVPSALLENEDTRAAVGILEEYSYTRQELEAYDKYLDIISVELALLEGREEEGIAKGIDMGIAQVARALKADGVSVSVITRATGLTSEEVAAL